MQGSPPPTELDVLLVIKIVLVSEEHNPPLRYQCSQLVALLFRQLRELDAPQLGAKFGSVVNALGDTGKEGGFGGVGVFASDAGGAVLRSIYKCLLLGARA